MANLIFRFRVSLEDQEHIMRMIDILPNQTFSDLQQVIGTAFNFEVASSACFYKCDHNWIKSKKMIESDPEGTEQTALKEKISDPHQKFYHVYHLEAGWNFLVELDKIIPVNNSIVDYPFVVDAKGKAPKQFPNAKKIDDEDESDPESGENYHDSELIADGSFDDMLIDEDGNESVGSSSEESPEPEEDQSSLE
ncbi:MAG: hypothetical protein HKN22_00355 [Bacteroidia bacterium]|nr:hypothetical protein [Bacteroidia bacterium]